MSSVDVSPHVRPASQIRFVNTQGQPPPKRRRINAACRTCRRRKTRCDGRRPSCTTCIESGQDCMGYAEENGGLGGDSMKLEHKGENEKRVPTQSNGNTRIEHKRRTKVEVYDDNPVLTDDAQSPGLPHPPGSHRVPYFRYFGPTAIVPGFKRMVVSVREHRRSIGAASAVSISSRSNSFGSVYMASLADGAELKVRVELPAYDQNAQTPTHQLIVHLVEVFFTHLGCNFSFLNCLSFLRRVEEKSAEPILVDAVCGLAARFSNNPLLVNGRDRSYPKSEYGHIFAQRAKAAVVDAFPCPTVAAVQACLLLAYEGFGANQDSALWMFLGCAIRMAIDLGLTKLDGVKYNSGKDPKHHRSNSDLTIPDSSPTISAEERKEIEQERIDTLWAVFMLDRFISSGTGRPVTMKVAEFEMSFPAITIKSGNSWPDPFPALIQIIHLYGRVSDLLNKISKVDASTQSKIEGLYAVERDLTHLYQQLDQRLIFNATNFQHYVTSGDGTIFILVHFWFHTLIMLLHRPTLMHSLAGPVLQLLPKSRELSMSSAKTIADILAFAELIDPRSFIGNPFTSQPIYIAACAFLMESAAHTSSRLSSRQGSPMDGNSSENTGPDPKLRECERKHTLLASAANQNYQRCYKALQQLETYWAGTRYILVALDQKARGIWDPETYTEKEYESTKIRNETSPHWNDKIQLPTSKPNHLTESLRRSPAIDSKCPVGWSLTGTTNSPNSNLTFMYQNKNDDQGLAPQLSPPLAGNMRYDPIRSTCHQSQYNKHILSQSQQEQHVSPGSQFSSDPADAAMLLGLRDSTVGNDHTPDPPSSRSRPGVGTATDYGVGDMMMESQEIDMSTLGTFEDEVMPWLEQDLLSFFDNENPQNGFRGFDGGTTAQHKFEMKSG